MSTGTLVFKNGAQLTLPDEAASDIASKLDAYWASPNGTSRVFVRSYSADGGSNNRRITVDLETLMYVLSR